MSVRPSHFWIRSVSRIAAPAQPSATGLPCIRPCFDWALSTNALGMQKRNHLCCDVNNQKVIQFRLVPSLAYNTVCAYSFISSYPCVYLAYTFAWSHARIQLLAHAEFFRSDDGGADSDFGHVASFQTRSRNIRSSSRQKGCHLRGRRQHARGRNLRWGSKPCKNKVRLWVFMVSCYGELRTYGSNIMNRKLYFIQFE